MKATFKEREVIKFVDYITPDGRIFIRGREKKQQQMKSGYLHIKVGYQGKFIACLSHRLIWTYFHGEIPEDKTINHKDLDKAHNHIRNLELLTQKENIYHAIKNGVMDHLKKHIKSAKLNIDQVKEIKIRLKNKMDKIINIAKDYNVSGNTISHIKYGRTWKYV